MITEDISLKVDSYWKFWILKEEELLGNKWTINAGSIHITIENDLK